MRKRWPPRQWEVWFASLRDGIKGEQTRQHNVIVPSEDRVNDQCGTATVLPITTTQRRFRTVVEIAPADAGIDHVSWVKVHQAQTLALSEHRFFEFRRLLSPRKQAEVAAAVALRLRGVFPQFDDDENT